MTFEQRRKMIAYRGEVIDYDGDYRAKFGSFVPTTTDEHAPGYFAPRAGASLDEILELFLSKAAPCHPVVLENRYKASKTQPDFANGGIKLDEEPISDVMMAFVEVQPKRGGGEFADFVALCAAYAERVRGTERDCGIAVRSGADARKVFDAAEEILRRQRALRALEAANAKPWLLV